MKDPSGMYKIYKIEDKEGRKYIGSTGEYYLRSRLHTHRRDKKSQSKKGSCSSSQLDLYDCDITCLEIVNGSNRKSRESYWIQNTECVNIKKLNWDRKAWLKEYYQKNKVKLAEQARLRYHKKKAECVQIKEIKSNE